MERESVVIYKSWVEAFNDLKDEDPQQACELMSCILNYATFGECDTDTLSKSNQRLFNVIRPTIESNNRKFEAGQKGGAPKGNTNAKKRENKAAESEKQNQNNLETTSNQPKQPVVELKNNHWLNDETNTVTVNVTVTDNVNDTVTVNDNENVVVVTQQSEGKKTNNNKFKQFAEKHSSALGSDAEFVTYKLHRYAGMEFALLEKAVELARETPSPSWKYAFSVLDDWQKKKIKTLSDWEKHEQGRKERRQIPKPAVEMHSAPFYNPKPYLMDGF